MKIVADNKIPHIPHFFTECDEITYFPGGKIVRADLLNADILLTRTVTQIDQTLLKNTSVRFVGSATTGVDHIDTRWLKENNIQLATSAGANAQAVVEYVAFCLDALKKENQLRDKKVAGIIGCGRIGRRVAAMFQSLGFDVICYDPLLTEKLHFQSVSLEKLMRDADIISIHTPLTKTGSHPTFHLINGDFLQKVKPNSLVINTARGSVIDQSALLSTLRTKNITLCLDVWEHEPIISLELLHKVTIGTPHIAGYSVQAKYRATEMIYEAAADFFQWKKSEKENIILKENNLSFYYDPITHTKEFKRAFLHCKTKEEIETVFTNERKKYPLRGSRCR